MAGSTSAWRARSRSRCRSPAATTKRRRWPARTFRGRKSCSIPKYSASRSRPRTILASSRSASSGRGSTRSTVKNPAKGERILAAGGNDKEMLELAGTFSAQSLGIEPQPIQVRLFAEDYFPGRERVYSPTYVLYVLNAEQHAIWLTEKLSKWHRQSLEVRDREMQLHETNKQLRELSPNELDQPDTRRRIETQAAAERANGRRLSNLVAAAKTWSGRRRAIPSSASAIWRSGPRCCRSSRTFRRTACRRSPTC